MSTPRSLRRHGQSGLTIIELLVALTVGTIVLLPMFGLVTLIIKRQEPTIKSANSSKQLRLFRTTMEKDWAAAKVIKANAVDQTLPLAVRYDNTLKAECNRGGMTSLPISATWNVTGPEIVILTSGPSPGKRIIYNKRPNTTLGGYDILRRECFEWNPDPAYAPPSDPSIWALGWGVDQLGGSQVVIVEAVQSFKIPEKCNPQATFPKATLPAYEMCDMNITVVGRDGQSSTVRLRQHAGRDS